MNHFNFGPPWLVPLILLLAALLVGLIKVKSLWEEMYEDVDPVSDRERLSELEEAHAAGELDAEELKRVRLLLSRAEASPTKAPEPLRRRPPASPDPSPADGGNSSLAGDAPAEADAP